MRGVHEDWLLLPWLTVLTPAAVAFVLLRGRAVRGTGRPAPGAWTWTLSVMAVVTLVLLWRAVPQWRTQTDEERDYFFAYLCGDRGQCPWVGNEMNRLRIPLGPLNRVLMALSLRVWLDLRAPLIAILGAFVLSTGVVFRVARRVTAPLPAALAALAYGCTPLLHDVISQPSNGAWLPLAEALVFGSLAVLAQDGGARALAAAAVAFACAVQLHGTAWVLLPGVLVAAWRAARGLRGVHWLGALAAGAFAWAPWWADGFETKWAFVREVRAGWMVEGVTHGTNGGGGVGTGAWAAFLLAAATGVLARRTTDEGPAEARVRSALLWAYVPPVVFTAAGRVLAGPSWADRYAAAAVAPAALCLAVVLDAGLRETRASLRHGALALGLTVIGWGVSTPWLPSFPDSLGLAGLRTAVTALGTHGFAAPDMERRVHGTVWNRWEGAHLFAGFVALPRTRAHDDGTHAQLSHCPPEDPPSARWHERIDEARRPARWLTGYVPALEGAVLVHADPFRVVASLPWTVVHALPADMDLWRRADPRFVADGVDVSMFGMPPALQDPEGWSVRAAVRPRIHPRVLVAVVDEADDVEPFLDGTSLDGTRLRSGTAPGWDWRWLLAPSASPATLQLRIRGTRRRTLHRVDVFDAPDTACERAAADPIRP